MLQPTHEIYLARALELAQIRQGFCAPNPAVGAVVVKDQKILGTGYHWAVGHPHAEVDAFQSIAAADLSGATLYVTLEPCCHSGRTPPCTSAIIAAKIACVVFAQQDPNPQVQHNSTSTLRAAGIEVIHLATSAITKFYTSYVYWWATQRPYVTAKLAISLDGKIAGVHGERVAITSAETQYFTHRQRKQTDAILTSVRTVIQDDPLLNVRLDEVPIAKPVYILDRELRTPLASKIFNSAATVTLLHAVAAQSKTAAYLAKGINCVAVDTHADGLNLKEVMQVIGRAGCHDLWIEAGGKVFAACLQQKLLQRAFIYVAPRCLGTTAQAAFSAPFNLFEHAKSINWQQIGCDAVAEISF